MRRTRLEWIIVIVIVYLTVAFGRYRFQHPELTETQLFLRAKEALLFR